MKDVQVLCALLQQALEGEGALAGLSTLIEGTPIRLHHYKKGEYLAHTGGPLRTVLVQLTGQVQVLKYSWQGGVARGGLSAAPQVYGLYELLNDIPEHTATLQADGPLVCAGVPPALYRRALGQNHAVALYSLQFLARFTDKMLNRNDRLTLNTPIQNLLLYLRDACAGQPLPHTLRDKKTQMAEHLHINLRTLYRLLNKLEGEGLIVRTGGKIGVDAAGYKQLEALLQPLGDKLV